MITTITYSALRGHVFGAIHYDRHYMYCMTVVSHGQTAFSVFLWGGGKKGLVWFTVATCLGTSEVSI